MNLRVLIILIIFVMGGISASSYGQTTYPQSHANIHVFSQILIHNSQGKLVAYREPTLVEYGSLDAINHYLNLKQKNIITKDGQKFEKTQFEERGIFAKSDVISEYNLVYSTGKTGILALTIKFDGFHVQPNDSYDIWWTILAPVI